MRGAQKLQPAVRFVLTCQNAHELDSGALWMTFEQYCKIQDLHDKMQSPSVASNVDPSEKN